MAACFQLRESKEYQNVLSAEIQERGLKDPGNKSICMSYDFHIDENQTLKLIEINTNAAFLVLGYEMYKMREMPLPVSDFQIDDLKTSIETEMQLQGKSVNAGFRTAIIDETPEEQRLFSEFLLFQSYFEKWGWNCQIADFRSVPEVDFIYNRYTDFFLNHPDSQGLREKFLNRQVCFSPNPYEYLLLADKQRMIDWNQDEFWEKFSSEIQSLKPTLQRNLPVTLDLNPQSADDVWANRKKYFFKPKRAYGSKQSYKGASISHRLYNDLIQQEMIAQEYVSAPERKFQTPDGEQIFKFDLRFYAYQDKVQMVVARIYQGQVTNLKTPYGGFAPVRFI